MRAALRRALQTRTRVLLIIIGGRGADCCNRLVKLTHTALSFTPNTHLSTITASTLLLNCERAALTPLPRSHGCKYRAQCLTHPIRRASLKRRLYGLIHARYIITTKGLQAMLSKFESLEFGRCMRIACRGAAVLPVGEHDQPRLSTVRLFCSCCGEIYSPRARRHESACGAA